MPSLRVSMVRKIERKLKKRTKMRLMKRWRRIVGRGFKEKVGGIEVIIIPIKSGNQLNMSPVSIDIVFSTGEHGLEVTKEMENKVLRNVVASLRRTRHLPNMKMDVGAWHVPVLGGHFVLGKRKKRS